MITLITTILAVILLITNDVIVQSLQKLFKKRELRVTICHKKPKKKSFPSRNPNPSFRTDMNKKRKHEGRNSRVDSSTSSSEGPNPTSSSNSTNAHKSTPVSGHKRPRTAPLNPAQKRINLKV